MRWQSAYWIVSKRHNRGKTQWTIKSFILQSSHIMILNSTKVSGNRTKDLEVNLVWTDGQTDRFLYTLPNYVCRGYNKIMRVIHVTFLTRFQWVNGFWENDWNVISLQTKNDSRRSQSDDNLLFGFIRLRYINFLWFPPPVKLIAMI